MTLGVCKSQIRNSLLECEKKEKVIFRRPMDQTVKLIGEINVCNMGLKKGGEGRRQEEPSERALFTFRVGEMSVQDRMGTRCAGFRWRGVLDLRQKM